VTTEREQYLLDRNLRLEHALLIALGEDIAPLPPPIERVHTRGLTVSLPPDVRARIVHRIYHRATADEIAQMRSLRRGGMNYAAIARQVPFSASTVRDHVHDVLMEREVGS
jgi:hypothetical protein